MSEGVISRAFAAAAAAADLETPILSAERAQLAQFLPASFTVTPGEAHPDALTRSVIAAIDAAAPPTGSVAAQFRETLKAPDPVAVVRDRVKAYKDRIAGLLADFSTHRGAHRGAAAPVRPSARPAQGFRQSSAVRKSGRVQGR